MNVGHHDEAVLDKLLGGLQRFDRIGKQIARIGMYLQLHPVRSERLAGQLGSENRLAGVAHARGIGQQTHAPGIQMAQDIVLRIFQLDALQRDGHQLAPAGPDGLAHQSARRELAGSDEQPRREAFVGNLQFFHLFF